MTTTAARPRATGRKRASRTPFEQWRGPLAAVLAVRAVVGLAAIPLAPALYKEHFVALVLLRPTKEVLLAGGFFVRRGDVALLPLVLATVPMLLVGVWLFFGLGRGYRTEIVSCDVPGLGGKVLPAKRVAAIRKVLDKKGTKVVVLGRLAAAPSTMFAATAGASTMSGRTFLAADTTGAVLSVVEVVGAGFLLGEAYDEAGRWITLTGVVVLMGVLWLFGRYLKRT